jgi:hypothetical protein
MSGSTLSKPSGKRLSEEIANAGDFTGGLDVLGIPFPEERRFLPSNASQIENSEENKGDFEERLTGSVKQMMFVSGETAEPSAETTGMIEELVKQQVIEMVSQPNPDSFGEL